MPFMSVNSYVGLGIQSARGTASSNVKFIPVMTPQITPMQKFLRDEAFRGSPVQLYNEVLGVRHDEYSVKGYAFADTFPLIAKAALGFDSVSGSTLYTHVMSLYNSAANASQPPAVTVQDFDGNAPFQILDAQLGELKLTFGAEAAFEWDAKFMGLPFTTIAAPTSSFSTEAFVPGWDVSATIGGVATSVLVSGDITMSRATAPIFTAQGTNAPYRLFAGPLDVKGTMKFIVENTDQLIWATSNATTVGSSPTALSQTTSATLPVTSATAFSAGGGNGVVQHLGVSYPFTYTGTSGSALTGVLLVNGPGFTPTATTDTVAVGSLALSDAPKPVSLAFTDPTTGHTITVQMSACQFKDAKRDRSKAFVEVDATFDAQANTTDAVAGAGGGYSPIKITATNLVSAVY